MVFYNSSLVGKIFRNVKRISPKETPGNGRHLGSYKTVRVCKRSFAGRMCTHWRSHRAGNPGTDYHPFHRFCQGSRLAAAGCQAHSPKRVQRRVWTTQEISVRLQSGGCIALLEPHVRRCKCSKTHNTNANAGVTAVELDVRPITFYHEILSFRDRMKNSQKTDDTRYSWTVYEKI